MTKSELNDPYFEWMYRLVVDDRYSNKSYRRLFYKLHDTEFAYTIPMDGNRAEDGIELRYRFGREQGYRDAVIANCLDNTSWKTLILATAPDSGSGVCLSV